LFNIVHQSIKKKKKKLIDETLFSQVQWTFNSEHNTCNTYKFKYLPPSSVLGYGRQPGSRCYYCSLDSDTQN